MVNPSWLVANHLILTDPSLNPALKAEILTLPGLSYLIGLQNPCDLDAIYTIRTLMKQELARYLKEPLLAAYKEHASRNRYQYTAEAVADRQLKNLSLAYLMLLKNTESRDVCMEQWRTANNMTDSLGVLSALTDWEGEERAQVLTEFYDHWQHDPNVLDKWFRIQASSELPNTLAVVKKLTEHPAFSITNPNKVYALIGAFSANLVRFHDRSGEGYVFLVDFILQLDPLNPQVAARMMSAFTRWKQFDAERQQLMKTQLQRLQAHPKLSKDVFEVVSKSLIAAT